MYKKNKKKILSAVLAGVMAMGGFCIYGSSANAAPAVIKADNTLVETGDRSNGADNFYQSDKLNSQQVTFKNIYNMEVAANVFTPKSMQKGKKYPAIIVGHPMGAVKEQSANLYAQKMAEQGYVTLALDLSYWGESEGEPRNTISPEIYSDDFSAAVDYLSTLDYVDAGNIGVIGICGSGSFAINEAKVDDRLQAVATVSMYNMGDAARYGLHKSVSLEQRKALMHDANVQRQKEFTGAEVTYTGGTPEKLDASSTDIDREFYDFYRTQRGSAGHGVTTKTKFSTLPKFMNFYPFAGIETISPRPLLFITGDNAHSKEFSEDAYRKASEPKELYYVKGAGHVDLYDRTALIPWQKLTAFFDKYLKN